MAGFTKRLRVHAHGSPSNYMQGVTISKSTSDEVFPHQILVFRSCRITSTHCRGSPGSRYPKWYLCMRCTSEKNSHVCKLMLLSPGEMQVTGCRKGQANKLCLEAGHLKNTVSAVWRCLPWHPTCAHRGGQISALAARSQRQYA